jgi:drug/metabolite transporter (DMT)-like permease
MAATELNAPHPTRGFLIALASAAILSTTAIFIRHLTQTYQIPSLVLAFWRDVFVVLTLLPVLGLVRPALVRVAREHLPHLVAYGLVLAVFNALWTLSVARNGAALATVLVYSSAAFSALLGRWILREELGWAKLLAVACSLGGCVLVSGAADAAAWDANVMGIVTGVLSGLSYATYSLMGRSASRRGLSPWTTLLYIFGFATVFLLVVNLLPGGLLPGAAARPRDLLWLGDSVHGWGILFLLAAGPTVAGFGLYLVSLGHLGASVANLVLTLEPAFTAVVAYVLLGERLSGIQITGSLVIMSGVVVLRIFQERPSHRKEPGLQRADEAQPAHLPRQAAISLE